MKSENSWEDVAVSDEFAQIINEIGVEYSHLEQERNKSLAINKIIIARVEEDKRISLVLFISDHELMGLPQDLLKEKIKHFLNKNKWSKNDRA